MGVAERLAEPLIHQRFSFGMRAEFKLACKAQIPASITAIFALSLARFALYPAASVRK